MVRPRYRSAHAVVLLYRNERIGNRKDSEPVTRSGKNEDIDDRARE